MLKRTSVLLSAAVSVLAVLTAGGVLMAQEAAVSESKAVLEVVEGPVVSVEAAPAAENAQSAEAVLVIVAGEGENGVETAGEAQPAADEAPKAAAEAQKDPQKFHLKKKGPQPPHENAAPELGKKPDDVKFPGRNHGWGSGEGPCNPLPCWAKDPEYKKLWDEDIKRGKAVCQLLKKYKKAPEEEREAIKAELRKALLDQFQAHQRRRAYELEKMKERIQKYQKELEQRSQDPEKCVEKRLQFLLDRVDKMDATKDCPKDGPKDSPKKHWKGRSKDKAGEDGKKVGCQCQFDLPEDVF